MLHKNRWLFKLLSIFLLLLLYAALVPLGVWCGWVHGALQILHPLNLTLIGLALVMSGFAAFFCEKSWGVVIVVFGFWALTALTAIVAPALDKGWGRVLILLVYHVTVLPFVSVWKILPGGVGGTGFFLFCLAACLPALVGRLLSRHLANRDGAKRQEKA